MEKQKIININNLYAEETNAKVYEIDSYINKAKKLAGEGNEVVLTGAAPIWLYLKVAHALHGKVKKLVYRSPATGDVIIFDHDPY